MYNVKDVHLVCNFWALYGPLMDQGWALTLLGLDFVSLTLSPMGPPPPQHFCDCSGTAIGRTLNFCYFS